MRVPLPVGIRRPAMACKGVTCLVIAFFHIPVYMLA